MYEFIRSLLTLSNLWAIFLVIVFFGGSIFVHELGHFLAARRRGAHVERFSIGFGSALWSRRGKDGVEYRIGWLPFGGYVLLPQLADLGPIEGEVKSDVTKLAPLGYASKLLILIAGASFNILFAFALASVIWVVGEPAYAELATTKIGVVSLTIKLRDGTSVPNPAAEAGLQAGDIVRSIDGHAVNSFEDIFNTVLLGSGRTSDGRRESIFVIERDGATKEVPVHPFLLGDEKIRFSGVEPAEDLTSESIVPGSPAALAGIQAGDRILALDGTPVFHRASVSEHLAKNPGRPTAFSIQRGTQQLTINVQPRLETDERGKPTPRIGLVWHRGNLIIGHPNPWTQVSGLVQSSWHNLVAIFSPTSDVDVSKLSGPIGIARELHRQAVWDFRAAIRLTILLNISLAIFNLLPIPVLDGGQVLFATIAFLRRRELPTNFILATQSAFFVLIISLLLYVSFFDVRRIVREVKDDRAEAQTHQAAK